MDIFYNMDELESIILSERSQMQEANIVWFHLYEMYKTGLPIQRH